MIYVDMELLPWKITNHHICFNFHRIEEYRKINMRSDAINNQKKKTTKAHTPPKQQQNISSFFVRLVSLA